jgi:hypothetical protein
MLTHHTGCGRLAWGEFCACFIKCVLLTHLAPVAVVYDGGGVYLGGGSSKAAMLVSVAGGVATAGGAEATECVGESGGSVMSSCVMVGR